METHNNDPIAAGLTETKKEYHAPLVTTLGGISELTKNQPPPGSDAGPIDENGS